MTRQALPHLFEHEGSIPFTDIMKQARHTWPGVHQREVSIDRIEILRKRRTRSSPIYVIWLTVDPAYWKRAMKMPPRKRRRKP